MDPTQDVPYGPNPVQKTGTVTVPRELLREIGVDAGVDTVHWFMNPHIPGSLVLVPSRQMARAMETIVEALGDVSR